MSIGNILNEAKGGSPADTKDVEQKLLEGLNPEQKEVVLHDKGPLLTGAVAGAGKTHALIRRVGYLVAVRDVPPSRVLAVTFSKKGADEMQQRLDALIGQSDARIGTFHSLAYEILRMEVPEYREWKVDDRNRYRICLKDATGYREMDWKAADVTVLEQFVSLCKCDLARPESDIARDIAQGMYERNPKATTNPSKMLEAYSRAEEIRRERQLLGFDDMLMEAVELLRDDDDLRHRWASKYDYVLQDEAQDQNLCQLLMGELLAKDHRNYMLVGDPAQTIYTWRGARPEKLLGFKKSWDAKLITMSRNYRCGEEIIAAANLALEAMAPETKLDMKMVGERGVPGEISATEYDNLDEEGEYIADRIKELMADGQEARDFAILYRTNAQSRAPEEALISARIPYRIIGGASFYERREVKNLLAYLRLAEGRGDLDDIGRAINTPFRFLGRAFVDKVRDAAKESKAHKGKEGAPSWPTIVRDVCNQARVQRRQKYSAEDWASMMEDLRFRIDRARNADEETDTKAAGMPARILEDIIRQTQYTEWLQKDEGEESTENSRVSNVREMVRAAGRFTSVADLLDYVDDTLAASKKQRKEEGDNPNKVVLCSLHRAKGLEWPNVFVAGASEKILPHGRCEDIEEERRLFYVGVTRARDRLAVSCVRNVAFGAKVLFTEPSRFIEEAGLELAAVESDFDEGQGMVP
jgi:DNA helicase-2/ATP-dependent DNA helicase PcrA